MPGTFQFAELNYNISDVYINAYNITANTYSATVDNLASPGDIMFDPDHDTDKLLGAGVTTRMISVQKGAKLTWSGGGLDRSVLATITGNTFSTSGLTPNQITTSKSTAGGAGMPYFGVICTGPTDDGGLLACGVQCVKLDKEPSVKFTGTESKYNTWECEGYAIPIVISSAYKLLVRKFYETAADFTAPTNAATFLSFFTA